MPAALAGRRKTDRRFLEQLLDTSKLDNYAVPIPIKADLRQYQQVHMCTCILRYIAATVQGYMVE